MKGLKFIAAFLLLLVVLMGIDFAITTVGTADAIEDTTLVDEVVFPHDEVIDVYVTIDDEDLAYLNNHAMAEEMVVADITYNGYTLQDVGIRPKGNSSLKQVANSDSDRYSFKIDMNYYVSGQNLLGITKLNLNNLFSDPTMMAEYTGYEALASIGADASRTTYVALYINEEYFGLYLSVEQVNEVFLEDHFEDSDGELYKPDSGVGSDLAYISDDMEDYSGIYSETTDDKNGEAFIELVTALDTGENVDDVLNVDSFLSYLAMSSLTIHLDSYQKGMNHNYYLYNHDGQFEWIAWDLNMIYNGFPSISDVEAMNFLIDEPVAGSMSDYPLVETVLADEDNLDQYHAYLTQLIEGYYQEDHFEARVLEIYDMIKEYVQADPTAFYSYEEFETALFEDDGGNMGLLNFMKARIENVLAQLGGEIPSTNDGMGNEISGGMGGRDNKLGADAGERPVRDMPDKATGGRPNMGQQPGEGEGEMVPEIDLESLLPEGMTMDDVPIGIRIPIENGEMPDMDEMKSFMEEAGIEPLLSDDGLPDRERNSPDSSIQDEDSTADPINMAINAGLMVISALAMGIISWRLSKQ